MGYFPDSPNEHFDESKRRPTASQVENRVKRDHGKNAVNTQRPRPAIFRKEGILVKWGVYVTIDEGQCLYYLNRATTSTGQKVPTPVIYGWYVYPSTKLERLRSSHEPYVYLMMEYIPSTTLARRWKKLTPAGRTEACEQIRKIWQTIRNIPPPPPFQHFAVCNVSGSAIQDCMFEARQRFGDSSTAGPFKSMHDFMVAFAGLLRRRDGSQRGMNQLEIGEEELRDNPDLATLNSATGVCLSHCDLNFGNVLVSEDESKPVQILAVIDWGQASFMPAFWEYCKASMLVPIDAKEDGYFDRMFDQATRASTGQHRAFDTIINSIGPM